MRILQRLLDIDRRWIFLAIAIAVIIPMFFTVDLGGAISPSSRQAYDAVDKVQPGQIVLVSLEYDPGTEPEVAPMALAVFRHVFRRGGRVVIMGLWPQGPDMGNTMLAEKLASDSTWAGRPIIYGRDYLTLGYMVGGMAVLQSMGTSIPRTFPKDYKGTPIADTPLGKELGSLADMALVVDLSSGDPGLPAWVQVGADRYHVTLVGGCTAVSAPGFYPYLQKGQIKGLLGGLKGAYEYEVMSKSPGSATTFMFPQSVTHIVICLFILFGNIAFFLTRKREG